MKKIKEIIRKSAAFLIAIALAVPCLFVSSGISYSPGDLNEDGTINENDSVLLGRYLAGWSVLLDKSGADLNASGVIDERDSVMLGRYLAGWNIDLANPELLTLTADGTSDYVIVRGKDAYISEVTASTELQSYIKKISGVEIPIVTDDTDPTDKEIVVGKTNREPDGLVDREKLGDEGLIIATVDKKLFLSGGELRGTLYAVYEFLDSYLGCRFYTDTIEKIPEKDTVVCPDDILDEQIPVFEFRDISSTNEVHFIGAKLKLNGEWASLSDEQGGKVNYAVSNCHSMFSLINPSIYGKEHPEYFTWEDGVAAQVCLTNPEVLEIVKASVRKWIEENPEAEIISVTQMDNAVPCLCENCSKVFQEEGSHSGAFIRFVNEIADDIKDDYPNVKIDTFAYRYTRECCKTKAKDNVIVRFCPFETCYSHPLEECGEDVFRSGYNAVEDLRKWTEIAENIYIWDYSGNFDNYVQPYPNLHVINKNIRTYADLGIRGIFEMVDYSPNSTWTEFNALRDYLLAKCLWNPYMTQSEYNNLMIEFLHDVYGDGWKYLKDFIDLEKKLTKDVHVGTLGCFGERIFPTTTVNAVNDLPADLTYDMLENYESVDWTIYAEWYKETVPSEIYTKGLELFDKAIAVANDEQKERLEISKMQVEFLGSYVEYTKLQNLKKDVSQLINVYLQTTGQTAPGGKTVTFRNTVSELAYSQGVEKYKQYNEELLSKLIEKGCVSKGEAFSFYAVDPESLVNPPHLWAKAS